jgi:eukaryotic-like serine/threonine-protein kinase
VNCPECDAENEATAANCVSCGKDLLGLGPGSVVANKYEILSLLGQGGMGVVFKARDRQLDEVVALKVLRTDAVITPEMSRRFRAEIKMARKVTHKNVCRIHEYGEDGPLQYISMAFMEGVDLKHVLKEQGALAPAEAYGVAIAVAEGLQAVHDEGIVHRDLKTPNIMRDSKGVVRLMDFGIAKQVEEGVRGLTATGMIIGTPEYMSPEQCRGAKVDSRSDIYALGIVVYELFTGRTPFRGDTAITTIIKHLQEPPPLEGPEAAGIPPAVIPVLAKALAKDAGARFATAHEMAVALGKARDQSPAVERTEDERKTTILGAVTGGDSSLEKTLLTTDKPTVVAQTDAEAEQPDEPTRITTAPKGGGGLKAEGGTPEPSPRPEPRPEPVPRPEPKPQPDPGGGR